MKDPQSDPLDELAEIIRTAALDLPETGGLEETFKWGQRAFLPRKNRVGTTIRIDQHDDNRIAFYVHCQTTLIETYKAMYPELDCEGSRAVTFDVRKPLPREIISVLTQEALLYHRNRKLRA